MRIRRISTLAALLLVSGIAAAQDGPRFEVVPFVGYRGGGDFDALVGPGNPNVNASGSFGVALDLYTDPWRGFELIYSRQQTEIQGTGVDLDVEHLQIGGFAIFNPGDLFLPYIAAAIGASRLSPDSREDETRLSGSLAFGLRMPLGEHIGLRFELRGLLVSMDGNEQIFCTASGSADCLVRAAGDTMFQYELVAGFGIGF